MPLSGVSGTTLTLDQIRRDALSDLGVSNPSASDLDKATLKLNLIKNEWQNRGIYLWKETLAAVPMSGKSAGISLPAAAYIIDIENNAFFRQNSQDYPMSAFSRTNYEQMTNKQTAGIPNRFFVDYQLTAPTMYFWPYWNYATGVVTGTDGNTYLCILDHTSTAASKPITGASYSSYWTQISQIGVTGSTWATATSYTSGVTWITANVAAQDLVNPGDNPDAPLPWMSALIDTLAWRLSKTFGKSLAERAELKQDARESFSIAMGGQPGSGDLRIYPDFRR